MSRSTTQPKKKGIVLVLEDTPIPAKHLNALQSSIEEMQFDVDVFENETFDKGITLIVQEVLQSRNTNPFLFYIRCHDDFVDQLNAILSSKTSVHYHQHVIIFIDCISKHESRGRTTVALPPDTLLFLSSTAADSADLTLFPKKLSTCFVLASDEDILDTCSKITSMCSDVKGWTSKMYTTLRSRVLLTCGLPRQASDSLSAPGYLRSLSLILFGVVASDKHSAHDFHVLLRQRMPDADIAALRNHDQLNLLQLTIDRVRQPFLKVFFLCGLWTALYFDTVPRSSQSKAAGMTTEELMMKHVKSRKFILKARDFTKWEESLEPIHRACREGVLHKVNEILKQKNPNLLITDAKRYNALHWACVNGVIEIVQLLIDLQVPDSPTKDGETAMHIACSMGHSHLIALLASKGYKTSEKDRSKMSPMDQTAVNGDLVCLRTLLACRVPLERTLLLHASANGQLKYVQVLLNEYAASTDERDCKGRTPLMLAAANDHLDVAKELIKSGVEWLSTDDYHRNVLHHAADAGGSELMEVLVNGAADLLPQIINTHDFYAAGELCFLIRGRDRGRKAWHYVESRRYLVSAFLKKANEGSVDVSKFGRPVKSGWGSDPEEDELELIEEKFKEKYTQPASDSAEPVTPNDMTPLMLASFREKSQSVDVLLKHNADPNEMDSTENTALHMAAMRGNQQIAQLLLKAKALVDARNKDGKTPKEVAQMNGHTELFNFFLNQPKNQKIEDFVQGMQRMAELFDRKKLTAIRESGADIRIFLIESLRDCNIEINQFLETIPPIS